MDRSLRLAALASAAVPGLDPMSVQEVVGDDDAFEVAFVQDTQQRRWVVRAPRTEVAAAHMDAGLAMLALLVRRVPFAVPAAKGFAPMPGIGRAAVYSYIPGDPLDFAALQPRHPITADLGRTIAMIHNVDRALFEEAGLPAYDAEAYRTRHLAEIDRGAATGRVPATLLSRWEEALDDVRLWRFAPTPVHGSLSGSDVLVTFPDLTDATRASVRGVTGWEAAKVADPADDFAALVEQASGDVVDAVVAAYAHVRVERPDEHVLSRARLMSELGLLGALLRAVAARDDVATEATTARLRRLDETVHDEGRSKRLRIVPAGSPAAPSPGRSEPERSGPAPAREATPSPAPPAAETPPAAGPQDPSAGGAEPGPMAAAPDADATDVIDVVDVDVIEGGDEGGDADLAAAPDSAEEEPGVPGASDPSLAGPSTSDPATSDPATSDPGTSDPPA